MLVCVCVFVDDGCCFGTHQCLVECVLLPLMYLHTVDCHLTAFYDWTSSAICGQRHHAHTAIVYGQTICIYSNCMDRKRTNGGNGMQGQAIQCALAHFQLKGLSVGAELASGLVWAAAFANDLRHGNRLFFECDIWPHMLIVLRDTLCLFPRIRKRMIETNFWCPKNMSVLGDMWKWLRMCISWLYFQAHAYGLYFGCRDERECLECGVSMTFAYSTRNYIAYLI